MVWIVEYIEAARKDLEGLDHSQRIVVLKAIQKVSQNPLPRNEGGYGKPLENQSANRLAGYLKIKLLREGLRVVYRLVKENETMRIIIISVRDDNEVYRLAYERTHK
jgi:mRNA interferase RelE/StbE